MRTLLPLLCSGIAGCVATSSRPQPRSPSPSAPRVASESAPERDVGPAEIEDYSEGRLEPPPRRERAPHPLADRSDEELEELLLNDREALGGISVGRPSAGALFGAVPMPEGPEWHIVNPAETWGTPETVGFIAHTIRRVNEQFPDTPVLPIGDISDKDGGHLTPHVSHQSGRDVDLGYYYTGDEKWYAVARRSNLDLARTWAFVKATVTETDVQALFIDRRIQKLLREYAREIGEDEQWLDEVFGGPSSDVRPLILHEEGHDTHIHVRYYNPIAQETGRRLYTALIEHKLMSPPTYYTRYKVRRGDTLLKMARKFKTSVKAIKRANRLRSSRIFANRTYKIPRKGGVRQPRGKLEIPERRLPPVASSSAPSSAISTVTDED